MNDLSVLLLFLSSLLLALMAMRWLCDWLEQPSVLGELVLGVIVGNVGFWFGLPLFAVLMNPESAETLVETSPVATHVATIFAALAELGAILLLFSAGLETSVAKMKRVGGRAVLVAVIGVVAPFALAYGTCVALHVQMSVAGHLFLAATLSATSVGITASVLKDLQAMDRHESEIILGAAVIDDVLGLVLLAIVSRIATSGDVDPWLIAQTSGTALLFVFLTLIFGETLAARGAKLFQSLDKQNGREFFALAFTFGFAWLAQAVELAAIVGGFAAGLVMRDHVAPLRSASESGRVVPTISTTIAPLERFLSPLFFLFVGMQVDVTFFFDSMTLLLAAIFTLCAVIGKLLSGIVAGGNLSRLAVGIGMIPRGEVGLVFLGVGRGLGVVNDSLFAALVIVVFATTIVTPPLLKWSLGRSDA